MRPPDMPDGKPGGTTARRKLFLGRYVRRMWNASEFMKTLKVVVFLCAFASIVSGEPTGCPDFEVELPCTGHASRESRPVIRAKDFGLSEANEHNASAIHAALAEAKRVGAARVELAPGTYRCFDGGRGTNARPDRSNIVIDGFTDFTFDGKGATLVFRRDHAPLDHQAAQLEGEANVEVQNCLRTVVENFNMDWDWENDPLAVWAKCVDRHVDEADNASYADFELDRPHPKYPQHVPVQLLTPMSADRTGGRGHPAYFGMSLGHIGTKSEWLSPTRLRVWPFVKPDYGHFSPEALARYKPDKNKWFAGKVDVGGTFVLAHGYYGLNGFVLTSNRHFTLRNVDVWACRGFGVETRGSQQYWQLVNVNVRSKPGAKYPVTSTADAHHVAQSLGYGKMVGCEVALNQDDHFNYHDRTQIAWTRGPRTVEVVNNRGVAYTLFKVGSRIALRQEDFAGTGWMGTIKRIDGEFITFDRDLPEQTGMLFVLMDADFATENFLFKDCWFHDSPWSRGLFNGNNATFDGCRFGPMTGRPLFLLACYTYNVWCEGIGCTNIVVRNCRFEDCLDLRQERGVCTQIMSEIAIPPSYVGMPLPISHPELARKVAENKAVGRALTPSEDALSNILVENCTFVNPRGYLFAARNGSNMTFRGNKAEWAGACEKLPYAGKVSVTGGRDNVVAECP